MGSDIFLSYSRADRPLAEMLVKLAAERGIEVWYDEMLEGGTDWRQSIVEALSSAKALIILFSEHSNASTQLIKELAIADNLRKRVVPVLIAECEPAGAYLYELASRNWINIHPNPETRLPQLVDALAKQLDLRQSAPAALLSEPQTTPKTLPRIRRKALHTPWDGSPAAEPLPNAAVAPIAKEVPPPVRDAPPPAAAGVGDWLPLGPHDLFFLIPIFVGGLLIGMFATGKDKNAGPGLVIIASFVYIIMISYRNAHMGRSIWSGKAFASYLVLAIIGGSPIVVGENEQRLPALIGVLIIALGAAIIGNVLHPILRKVTYRNASPLPGDTGPWFPLGRYDLFVLVPVLVAAFLIDIYATGNDKNAGLGLSAIAFFIYMLVISVRNARLNRSISSGKSFASYAVVLIVGCSPILISEEEKITGFVGLIVISLGIAVIANVLQVILRKVFQQKIFRNNIGRPLEAPTA